MRLTTIDEIETTVYQRLFINTCSSKKMPPLAKQPTNGKIESKAKIAKINRNLKSENTLLHRPFTTKDLNGALYSRKIEKQPEQMAYVQNMSNILGIIQSSGFFNQSINSYSTKQIPKSWRKSKVIALLKPEKDDLIRLVVTDPFRSYAIYSKERPAPNKIKKIVDHELITQQRGAFD